MIPHVLTLMWLIPIVGAVLILLVPKAQTRSIKVLAALITGVTLLLAIWIFVDFDRSSSQMQYQDGPAAWIPAFNIYYHLGIDGISVWMVLLTALLGFVATFASWGIQKAEKAYYALYLLLIGGLCGVFSALDFILFYIFWEVTLLPMYFLIGVWGGPRREYAAIKFFLYTLLGSVLMLLAILAMYFTSDPHTFNILELQATGQGMGVSLLAKLVWFGFFLGFAVKVPIFPFHTWLPDAHVEAPTPISVILAGVLLKMGTYGLVRINLPILPEATRYFGTFLAVLAVINIIYGSLCALAQKDMKKLVAYSSIGHMGFVLLGIASMTSAGLNGAIFQMLSHGLLSGMLFLIVGVIYDRAHHRYIVYPDDYEDPELAGKLAFGGLGIQMPIYTGVVMFAFFGSLGLPGLSGFVGEVLALLGAFNVYRTITILSVLGLVFGAAYFLWALQRMFFGTPNPRYEGIAEINARELVTLVPLLVLVVLLGVYPRLAIDMFSASHFLQNLASFFPSL